jgi:hypothetical protein
MPTSSNALHRSLQPAAPCMGKRSVREKRCVHHTRIEICWYFSLVLVPVSIARTTIILGQREYIPKWSAYMKRWELFKFWRSFGITSTITFVQVWIEPFADTDTALHGSWWNLSEFLLKFGRCLTLSNAPYGYVCDYVVPFTHGCPHEK